MITPAFLLMGASSYASWPSSCSGSFPACSSTQVLMVGGENSSGSILSSAELFDHQQEPSRTGQRHRDGRAFQTATLLKNGSVLIAGGVNNGGSAIYSADLYVPSSEKFTAYGR